MGYDQGDKVEVWSNTHLRWCPGKVISFRAQASPPDRGVVSDDGITEMKVSAKKGTGFYHRAAESFLKGVDARVAKDGKQAVEAKPAVDMLKVSGTGEAIGIVVAVAAKCERNRLA